MVKDFLPLVVVHDADALGRVWYWNKKNVIAFLLGNSRLQRYTLKAFAQVYMHNFFDKVDKRKSYLLKKSV